MTLRNFKLNLYKQILYKNSRTKVKQESLSINAIRFYHTHTHYDNVIVYSNFTLSPPITEPSPSRRFRTKFVVYTLAILSISFTSFYFYWVHVTNFPLTTDSLNTLFIESYLEVTQSKGSSFLSTQVCLQILLKHLNLF